MYHPDPVLLSVRIKESLRSEGFGPVGIAPAAPHQSDADSIASWVAAGRHGSLGYMERNNDKRADITSLLPGARSVIVAAMNYYNEDIPGSDDRYFIARYARGMDYHIFMKEKLYRTLSIIKTDLPGSTGRVFVDSAPVTEKAWAERAGIGWRGRNSLIINREIGSFFLLGVIVTSAELVYDTPVEQNYCGDCHLCIDACPTGAINNNYTIDARKCISYHTIEIRGEQPPELLKGHSDNSIFGCDICQEACPWNNKAKHHDVPEFMPSPEVISLTRNDWQKMTEEKFHRLFSGTPLERPGYKGMMHNVAVVSDHNPI